jgi:dihydrofolate reductase
MRKIRLYIAASLDGYISTPDGGVAWLESFQEHDYGFAEFFEQIGVVVMGRATYDQVRSFDMDWPYAGREAMILTSRPLEDNPPAGVRAWSEGVEALAAYLREGDIETAGDAWVIGGAKVGRAFLDAGAIDEIQLFVMPILLGEGIRLFPDSKQSHTLELLSASPRDGGAVEMVYRVKVSGEAD